MKPLIFIKSAYFDEEETVMEMDVFPNTGNSKHYHTQFDKTLEVLTSELFINKRTFKSGESLIIPIGNIHSFKNITAQNCRIRITLRPGNTDFEDAMNIYYGLRKDGKLNKNGIPKRISDLAIINWLSNSKTGTIKEIILKIIAQRAIRKGRLETLTNRYTY